MFKPPKNSIGNDYGSYIEYLDEGFRASFCQGLQGLWAFQAQSPTLSLTSPKP